LVKPGQLNARPDHLLQIETGEEPTNLEDNLPDVSLFAVSFFYNYFEDITQSLHTETAPEGYTVAQKKQLVVRATDYTLIAGKLYKMGLDEVLRQCLNGHE